MIAGQHPRRLRWHKEMDEIFLNPVKEFAHVACATRVDAMLVGDHCVGEQPRHLQIINTSFVGQLGLD